MKYLIAAAVLAVGLFMTTGTASAQHHGDGHHGGYHHGYRHGGHHGFTQSGYTAPRVGVYSGPAYGRGYYQPSYGRGVYFGPVQSGSYAGHGYDHHNSHGHH